MADPTKTCCMCKIEQPLEHFYRQKSSKDGRHARCKLCSKEYSRLWKERNPERAQANIRRWREENREHVARSAREWRERNKDARAVYEHAYRQANHERILAKMRQTQREKKGEWREKRRAWVEANKDRYIAQSAQRRILNANLTEADREYMAILRNDPCSYCGAVAMTLDHVVALSTDGEIGWTNLTSCCRSCNSSKKDLGLLLFLHRKSVDREYKGAQNDKGKAA